MISDSLSIPEPEKRVISDREETRITRETISVVDIHPVAIVR